SPWLTDRNRLKPGRRLRVTALSINDATNVAAEIEDDPPGSNLIYADGFLAPNQDSIEAWLVWLASRQVAEWNASHGTEQPIYAVGQMGQLLSSYRDSSAAAALISHYGRPDLSAAIPILHNLVLKEPSRPVIVEGLPFMPKSQVDVPVGGWGFFPLRVFGIDAKGESLLYPSPGV
ncbi:MAG TPA: hypothetical protein VIX35_06770, partial [Vicinamibacterales bacterium]